MSVINIIKGIRRHLIIIYFNLELTEFLGSKNILLSIFFTITQQLTYVSTFTGFTFPKRNTTPGCLNTSSNASK